MQPVKRIEFRDAMARLERTPRRAAARAKAGWARSTAFLGAKGGVGTTTLAVNFAGVLAQRKKQTVLVDLDFTANDCAMQTGASPQHSLLEVGENLARMDQALFEGLVTRDPLGFFLVGPPAEMEQRRAFTEPMFREFASFLVEKYEAVVIDAGRWISDEVVLAALQSSSAVFLVMTQEFPSIRNAQRYIAALMRLGFNQDQIRIVVNGYQKKPGQSGHARTDPADAQSAGVLRHSGVAGRAGGGESRPAVRGRPRRRPAIWTARSALSSTRRPAQSSNLRALAATA